MSDENKYPLVMDNSLLSYVPFFDWLNELTEDKFDRTFSTFSYVLMRHGRMAEVVFWSAQNLRLPIAYTQGPAEVHSAETCSMKQCVSFLVSMKR